MAALAQTLEGVRNGDRVALGPPWFQITFSRPLGDAEGPEHLGRIDRLVALRKDIAAQAPAPKRHPLPLVDGRGSCLVEESNFPRQPAFRE
ncbi:hypothetical protein MASR1M32_05850 [Rhodobacter sp.]